MVGSFISYSPVHVAGRHPLKQGLKQAPYHAVWIMRSGRRAASTKTRIETKYAHVLISTMPDVAGRHPLKQGLKLNRHEPKKLYYYGRRAASTKTRIETTLSAVWSPTSYACRRAASTKTRIETALWRAILI